MLSYCKDLIEINNQLNLLMKLTDIKNQAVLMCGISGSGKTHFAILLEKLGFIRLSVDKIIWKKVGLQLFSLQKEEKAKLFAESRDELFRRIVELLKSGKRIVVDSTCCKRKTRNEMRDICAEIGVDPVFLYCQANKEVLKERLSRRRGLGPDDLLVSTEELSEYWEGFEPPQPDESDIIYLNKVSKEDF